MIKTKKKLFEEDSKDRQDKTFQQVWVHPSKDYDEVDMITWCAEFTSDRIKLRKKPESQSGWDMGWYSQLGYDLNRVYSGDPPVLNHSDVSTYGSIIAKYKKQKLNYRKI